jgi:hypothetical protein
MEMWTPPLLRTVLPRESPKSVVDAAVPSGPPLIVVQQNRRYADLVSQMGNHRGREVGFIFGKSRALLVKGKLDGEAEFAGVGFTRQQYKLFRSKRPALGELLG